jgi:hypothetical protein
MQYKKMCTYIIMTDCSFTSIDEMPRYEAPNPFKYDNLTLAKRKKEVEAAFRDYPHVPPSMIEMAWDLIQNNSEEEIADIINSGKWSNAPKKERATGGVVKSMVIE